MTKKELSQLYYLKKEIKEQQRRLDELETAATACTAKITGLPNVEEYPIKLEITRRR